MQSNAAVSLYDMAAFTVESFYEKNSDICSEIQSSYKKYFDKTAKSSLAKLNPDDFIPGLDLQMMCREMYWAAEGCLWEMLQKGKLDASQMEKDFSRLLQFWKHIYTKKEEQP